MTKEEKLRAYSAYLPYGLKIGFEGEEHEHSFVGLELSNEGVMLISPFGDFGRANIENCKPILYPLEYLTKEIEHEGERFVPTRWLRDNHAEFDISKADMEQLISMFIHVFRSPESAPYYFIKKLLEWHFNVFQLPEDQFINKSTLKP